MKAKIFLILLLFTGFAKEASFAPQANAQTSHGCPLASWVLQQQPHSTGTPTTPLALRDTVITVNGSQQHISLPAGFTMAVFASVPQCRGLALSPDGVIYATSYDGNVYALPDHNLDGVADSIIVITSGLNDPHGIGFYKGELYVSNNSALYHVYTHGSRRMADSLVQIVTFPPSGGHHSRNFVIDTVNNKFYVQIGSNGNMERPILHIARGLSK